MKFKKIIGGFLIVILCFFIFCVIVYFYGKRHDINCSPYNLEYLDWLPYKHGEKVVFTDDTVEKVFIVKEYKPKHTDFYRDDEKGGYCEDAISATLVTDTTSLEIIIANIGHNKSYFGFSVRIILNNQFIYSENSNFILHENYIDESTNGCKIDKKKGLVKIKLNDKIWKLKK